MADVLSVTGMVLGNQPVGEYDKRVVILTKERGKVSAFARGARKPNSKLSARTAPFCFGTFLMYEGKNSYTIAEAQIDNYFEGFRDHVEAYMYGTYFLELADYYTRENNDELEMLKVLYQSLRALFVEMIPHNLVRIVYEIRSIVVNGEFPGIPKQLDLSEDARYTISYIATSSLDKLYTFVVSERVIAELEEACVIYRKTFGNHVFKSLEVLQALS